jgi:RNA polymerase sigma-70 factor (ECF subfamily)
VTDRQAGDQSPAVGAAQARAGTAADFTSVFAEQLGYVVRSLRRLGVPERDLEDVAHDTFIVVHRKLVEYDTSRPLRPFLFGIAYRVASDYRRRARHRYERLVDPPAPPQAASSPEQALDVAQHQRLVLAALQGLDPERCAVFVMMDIDSHAAPEVATALAIPLNTVYSRLRIARGEFAAAVQRLQHRGGRR